VRVDAKPLVKCVEAIGLVPARAGIVASEFIRVRYDKQRLRLALAAEAFGEMGVRCEGVLDVPKDWEFHVDRTLFEPFVLASKDSSKSLFKFTINDQKLLVKCGRRSARFNPVDAVAGYAIPPGKEGVPVKLSTEQRSLLQLASKYATQDPTMANYNCVYLKRNNGVLAASGPSIIHVVDSTVAITVPLPLLLVNILASSQEFRIDFIKKMVRLRTACGAICQTINQKALTEFPAKSLLKQLDGAEDFPLQFSIKAVSLLSAIKRQEAIIQGSVKRDLVARIRASAGDKWISITCSAPQGKFTERVLLASATSSDVDCELMMSQLLPLAEFGHSLVQLDVKYETNKSGVQTSNFFIAGKAMRLIIARRIA
jgi:hypothetical protein